MSGVRTRTMRWTRRFAVPLALFVAAIGLMTGKLITQASPPVYTPGLPAITVAYNERYIRCTQEVGDWDLRTPQPTLASVANELGPDSAEYAIVRTVYGITLAMEQSPLIPDPDRWIAQVAQAVSDGCSSAYGDIRSSDGASGQPESPPAESTPPDTEPTSSSSPDAFPASGGLHGLEAAAAQLLHEGKLPYASRIPDATVRCGPPDLRLTEGLLVACDAVSVTDGAVLLFLRVVSTGGTEFTVETLGSGFDCTTMTSEQRDAVRAFDGTC
jgi:hypothetical protein